AANTYLVDGDTTAATERFVASTVTSVRALGNVPTTMRSISNLARLHLLQGKLHQAALTIEQVQQLASRHGGLQDLLNGADYYFILGDLLREWNQLDKAEQHLVQGIEMVKTALTADAEMIMRGYLALARLQQARGWCTQALETLDTFMQVAYQSGFAPLLRAYAAAVRTQVELAQGNVAAALQWVARSGISPNDDSLSLLHEREHLTLARVFIAQGRLDSRTPFLHQALDLLNRLLQDAESKSRMSSTLEILMLQALSLDAQDRRTEAMARLRRALALAEPEGYVRLFLDEGAPMITLLHQASTHGVASGYVSALLEAAGEPVAVEYRLSPLRTDPLVEPLTQREREVLQLLADGASNREIADHLVLSVNTVKKHVLNICGKLGVQSRTQAIAKARSLNL
ncbi:MAG TPA: LuxR C-terminal-related transcriptional regulator, partial [Ktedonobacteraceae bacterium]|nr:LuxR C-terminal-related transcriptional regulator [Ktedonobacteraceae bacterium]